MQVIVREVECDDWKAIYLNDNLVVDGHNVSIVDVCDQLDYFINHNNDPHKSIYTISSIKGEHYWLNDNYAEEHGFPEKFSFIPKYAFE